MTGAQAASKSTAPWNDPHADPYIHIENITKKFGDFTAVNNVSLDIYKSELFCLLGGSGCGKSTLLRMLAGFETPTSGRILLDGADMAEIPPYERPVNMMFQSYALFPHMTIEKNVAFGLKQDGIPAADGAQRQNRVELLAGGRALSKLEELAGTGDQDLDFGGRAATGRRGKRERARRPFHIQLWQRRRFSTELAIEPPLRARSPRAFAGLTPL